MLGFIKKDFAMIKNSFKILVVIFVIYVVMGFTGQMDISFVVPFLCVTLMMSTFSYDEYNKWDAYAATFPKGRKNSVMARYVETILLVFLITVVSFLVSLLISYVRTNTIDYLPTLEMAIGSVFATLLLPAILYPLAYKWGIEKARIGIFVLVFGFIFAGGIITQYLDLSALGKYLPSIGNYWILVLIGINVLSLLVSYFISLKIQCKKEF